MTVKTPGDVTTADLLKKIRRLEDTLARITAPPENAPASDPGDADAWIRYAARQADRAAAERRALSLDPPLYAARRHRE